MPRRPAFRFSFPPIAGGVVPLRRYTGAIHVYGGDFVNTARSQWDPQTLLEEPYDLTAVRALFDAAESAYQASLTT